MSDSYQTLALEIARLNKRLNAMSGPQLAFSSIEDGAVEEYDIDGQLSSVIGQQYDRTHGAVPVAGPLPPTPSAPTVTIDQGVVIVGWDGTWVQTVPDMAAGRETVAPLDFTRVEVHVNGTPDYSALEFETMRGTIESARGGQVVIPLPAGAVVYARLVARTAPGKISIPSVVVGPASPGLISADDIDIDFSSLGGNHIFFGPTEPTAIAEGDLWLKTPENVVYGWSVGDDAWIVYRDQGVVQALLDAQAAAEAAQDAQDDADAASALATLAKSTADSKITVYRQASAPTGGTYKVNGDLWIDSTGLISVATTVSGGWTTAADQRIATALTNAGTAQTTANLKTTVFAQISQPSTTGRTVGDLWIDTDDGNTVYDWPVAAVWTKRALGATALSVTARELGGITTYFQTSQPATGMIAGDLWIDTDDTNKTYRYGTSWVLSDDQRIGTALTTATTANTAVATKITTFAQTSAPSSTGRTIGDLWIDTDDNNVIYTWTGAWTIRPIGKNALTADAVDGKTITGAVVQTSNAGARVKVYQNGATGRVEMFTAASVELPAYLETTLTNDFEKVTTLSSGGFRGFTSPTFGMTTSVSGDGTTGTRLINVGADQTNWSGGVDFSGLVNVAGLYCPLPITAPNLVVKVASLAARNALTKYDGLTVMRMDTAERRLERWAGTPTVGKWCFEMSGEASVTTTSAGVWQISHGAGQIPLVVTGVPMDQATEALNQVVTIQQYFKDATFLNFRANRTDSAATLPSQPIKIAWWARF